MSKGRFLIKIKGYKQAIKAPVKALLLDPTYLPAIRLKSTALFSYRNPGIKTKVN